MAEERRKICKFCGLTAPKGHPRPYTWIKKHEKNCPSRNES